MASQAPDLVLSPCRAEEEQARRLMAWRNHPTSLVNSFHPEPKTWPAFWDEYRRAYLDPALPPPVWVLQAGQPVAFLRFRPVAHPAGVDRRCCDISIIVAPERQGQGLGPAALRAAAGYLAALGWQDCLAEVFPTNQASRSCFERAGYHFLDQVEHLVADSGRRATVRRYLLALDRA